MRPFSLYIHIPYCFHKCPYCDFNTYAVPRMPEEEYVAALLAELDTRAATPYFQGRKVQTVYFGGGTPSLLSVRGVERILERIRATFEWDRGMEISLETNPGSVTTELLGGYHAAGVNRLSFGAQSLNSATLRALGRIHTPEQVEHAVVTARQSSFKNISIDLMFGAPEQTVADLEADIAAAAKLAPQHISTYGLTIEKGTPFFVAYKRGTLKLPPEDVVVTMLERSSELLESFGYHRYEISNYAHTGYEAQHNLAYWNGDDYLGLGAGAHSYVRAATPTLSTWGERWSNYAPPTSYMSEAQNRGIATSWSDTLDLSGAMFEYFFLGLRKLKGVSLKDFERVFPFTAHQVYAEQIRTLTEHDLLLLYGDMLRLSPRGLMVADSVIERFAKPEIPPTKLTELPKPEERQR
jgi:oxygen-independent coproporphyrinogen-3 oxidase